MAVSTAAKRALLGRSSTDGILVFLTFTTAAAVNYRFVNNRVNLTGPGSVSFTGYPFHIGLAGDNDDSPMIDLTIGNIDRQIMAVIEAETSPIKLTCQVALISTPTTVEKSWSLFKIIEVNADAMFITAQLTQNRLSTEIWPRVRATRERCPSLFRRTD